MAYKETMPPLNSLKKEISGCVMKIPFYYASTCFDILYQLLLIAKYTPLPSISCSENLWTIFSRSVHKKRESIMTNDFKH